MVRAPRESEMSRAVDRRDAAYEGVFFVAVRTTGVFCRPSCPSRTRLPPNAEDFPTAAALDEVALGNGYDSHRGFREAFSKTFGQPPGGSRAADCIVTDWVESPLGPLLLAATAEGICLVEFSDRKLLDAQLITLR